MKTVEEIRTGDMVHVCYREYTPFICDEDHLRVFLYKTVFGQYAVQRLSESLSPNCIEEMSICVNMVHNRSVLETVPHNKYQTGTLIKYKIWTGVGFTEEIKGVYLYDNSARRHTVQSIEEYEKGTTNSIVILSIKEMETVHLVTS